MRVAFGQSTAPITIGFTVSFSSSLPLSLSLFFSTMETDEEWLRDFSLPTADCFYCLSDSSHPREDDFFLPSDLSLTLPTPTSSGIDTTPLLVGNF